MECHLKLCIVNKTWVSVSADLTWKDQVMGQAAQAMKLFGYIMQIWSPQLVDLALKLEKFNKGLLDTSWIYHLLVVKIIVPG